ncbi:MAG: rod shape-determining protein MreD [Deltaproteobacteria bacterium]|nr:rod shape-determining protein MreD [Deltaproteobacteria bacterium]
MRLNLLVIGLMLIGAWLNIVLNSYVQLGSFKINWILVIMLVLTFRHSKHLIPFLGILAGLICDALSHGIMGLYAISFFLTLLFASLLNKLFYANTFLTVSLAVLSMSVFEGWISISILGMLGTEIDRSSLLLSTVLPLSVLHGLGAPLILLGIMWCEKLFLRNI